MSERGSALSWWRGTDIPDEVSSFALSFDHLRGDEVFTEELVSALAHRDERCVVFRRIDDVTGDSTVAVALENERSSERTCTIETAAPLNRPDLHHALLRSVAAQQASATVLHWRPPTTSPFDHFPLPSGAIIERTILEMHVELPLNTAVAASGCRCGLEFRSFADASFDILSTQRFSDSVIRINNLAFADHPEQGALTPSSFGQRTSMSWFDPHGLIVAAIDGVDVGFCWMKCDHPRPAELYVVAVNPNAGVRGLGRNLVHRGFSHAVSAHQATEAMLFVDANNKRAVDLYVSLGFTAVRRQDVVVMDRWVDHTHREKQG